MISFCDSLSNRPCFFPGKIPYYGEQKQSGAPDCDYDIDAELNETITIIDEDQTDRQDCVVDLSASSKNESSKNPEVIVLSSDESDQEDKPPSTTVAGTNLKRVVDVESKENGPQELPPESSDVTGSKLKLVFDVEYPDVEYPDVEYRAPN